MLGPHLAEAYGIYSYLRPKVPVSDPSFYDSRVSFPGHSGRSRNGSRRQHKNNISRIATHKHPTFYLKNQLKLTKIQIPLFSLSPINYPLSLLFLSSRLTFLAVKSNTIIVGSTIKKRGSWTTALRLYKESPHRILCPNIKKSVTMERLLLLAPNPTILSVSLHLCTGKAHVKTFSIIIDNWTSTLGRRILCLTNRNRTDGKKTWPSELRR